VRLTTTLVGTVLALTAAPLVIAALISRSFIFHPTALSPERVAGLAEVPGWQVARVQTAPAITVVGLVRPPAEPGRPWILFFGGNAMDLSAGQLVLDRIDGGDGHGLAVFAYRGYDGSGGKPTEPGLLHDAEAVAAWLEAEHGATPRDLVVVGQSLGSGVAAHLAAARGRDGRPVRGLALLSPYTDMGRVFDDHVPLFPVRGIIRDRFSTEALVDDLTGPVVIVHGAADDLIRPHHAQALAGALGRRARLLMLRHAGHNDLWEDARTVAAVRTLLPESRP
jgi:uncharacterized protein